MNECNRVRFAFFSGGSPLEEGDKSETTKVTSTTTVSESPLPSSSLDFSLFTGDDIFGTTVSDAATTVSHTKSIVTANEVSDLT